MLRGTAALFNCLNWVKHESRYALVLIADIAVYEKGPAQTTGGAGAIALLIGHDAPLIVEDKRVSASSNKWDFYKPNLSSEFPTVDGKHSQDCYLEALCSCVAKIYDWKEYDYNLFHSPYHGLVKKGSAWANKIAYEGGHFNPSRDEITDAQNKYKDVYQRKVLPGSELSQKIGNTYTCSLYFNLAWLVYQYCLFKGFIYPHHRC